MKSVLKAIAVGVVTGALPGVVTLIFGSISWQQFPEWVLDGIVFGLLIGVPCQLLGPVVGCRVRHYSPIIRSVAILGWFFLVAVVGTALGTAILMPTGHLGSPDGGFLTLYVWMLRMSLLITFTVGIVAWVVVSLQSRLTDAQEELHRRQMAEERANKMAVEARIASLESRIHPHFLFNTLNSISALVREDPVQAERTIEKLAALLRASLDSENAGLVTVREELGVVRDYLDIEKVRFGPRLRYRIEVEPAAESLSVPALSIQTLAENSVKYAVGVRANGAEIVITARARDGRLRVEVADDGPGFPVEAKPKPGHGIDLLQRRLSALFGSSASLELGQRDGRTMVSISVAAASIAAA
jgi:LytS/YehU family sensor histidine kinase